MDRVKRIWYLSPMRAAKVQASLRIRTVSPEPSLLAHISSESRGTFRQKARSLAPLNGWAYAVKICNDGMLEDTNLLDGALNNKHYNLPWCFVLESVMLAPCCYGQNFHLELWEHHERRTRINYWHTPAVLYQLSILLLYHWSILIHLQQAKYFFFKLASLF